MGSTGSVIQKDLRCAAQHACGSTAWSQPLSFSWRQPLSFSCTPKKPRKSRDLAVYDLDQRRLIDAEITRRTIDFLITDPKEEYPTTALRNSWNAGPAMKIVAEFENSLKKHPPI